MVGFQSHFPVEFVVDVGLSGVEICSFLVERPELSALELAFESAGCRAVTEFELGDVRRPLDRLVLVVLGSIWVLVEAPVIDGEGIHSGGEVVVFLAGGHVEIGRDDLGSAASGN